MKKEDNFARRGTTIWIVNRFRQLLMAEWTKDLKSFEEPGVGEHRCPVIRHSLQKIVSELSQSTVGSPAHGFYQRMSKIFDNYIVFNGIDGNTIEQVQERKKQWKKLKKNRDGMSDFVGRNQKQLSKELDEEKASRLWDEMESMAKGLTGQLPRLERALRRVKSAI